MTFDPQPMLIWPALAHWSAIAGGLLLIVFAVSLFSIFVSQPGGALYLGKLLLIVLLAGGLDVALSYVAGWILDSYYYKIFWWVLQAIVVLTTLALFAVFSFRVVIGKLFYAVGKSFFTELAGITLDVFSLSPSRIWALAKLTFVEAYRRKALAVFVVFALLFMFAGWFMGGDPTAEITADQVKVYVSFVLRTISWLTLPLVLVLSSFGIPEDIRLRSLHTVVTKPARRLEIVLGRVIGFSLIGTLVLSVMSVVGWIWIIRQVPPSAKAMLVCRVPVYGTIKFHDRNGDEAKAGVNTGDIWEFRSYIEGATKSRAIWTFHNIGEWTLDSNGKLNLENQFLAFRSYKGDIKTSIHYDYQLRNPETNLTFPLKAREVNENRSVSDVVDRTLVDEQNNKKYDLIKDFVTADGSLTIEVSCIDREQYLGMARPDLFIRMPTRGFVSGFFKAALGIEFMMILVVVMAVTASTFLKGPIASVLTFVLLILGGKDSQAFMDQLVLGRGSKDGFQGGGFFESIYRIYTHMNPTTDLPLGFAFDAMKFVDGGLTSFLWLCKQVIPRLEHFNMSEYVANGFDVPFDSSLAPSLMVMLGYLLPCVLLGYFALRIRELESK